jgi:hypothetical protein
MKFITYRTTYRSSTCNLCREKRRTRKERKRREEQRLLISGSRRLACNNRVSGRISALQTPRPCNLVNHRKCAAPIHAFIKKRVLECGERNKPVKNAAVELVFVFVLVFVLVVVVVLVLVLVLVLVAAIRWRRGEERISCTALSRTEQNMIIRERF